MDPRGWTLARGFSPPPPRGARGRGSTRAAHPGSTSKQVSGLADRQSTAAVMMMMSLNRKTNWRRSTVGKRSFSTNHFAACDAARKICCRIRKQIYGTQSGNFEKKPNSSQPDPTRDPGGLRRTVGQLSALLCSHAQFGLDRFRPRARPFLSHRLPGSFEPRAGAYGWRTRASTGRCHSATAPT